MKDFIFKHKLVIISIAVLSIFLIGGTYALLTIELFGEKSNAIIVGTLELELDESTCTGINISNGVPVTDTDGMKEVACTFTLENTGEVTSDYTIYLDDVDLEAGEERMQDKFIKYSLIKNSVNSINLLTTTGSNPNRVIDNGVLNVGDSNSYELRLWIDSGATAEVMGTIALMKLRVAGTIEIEGDYENVNDMKSDSTLIVGDKVTTKGFYVKGDGGKSTYNIVDSSTLVANDMDIILLDNGLVAQLEVSSEINVIQLGARTIKDIDNYDNTLDVDSSAILNRAFNLGVSTVNFPLNKSFLLQDRVFLYTSNVVINGNGSKLYNDDTFNQSLTEESRIITLGWPGFGDRNKVSNITWNNLDIISKNKKSIPNMEMQMGLLFLSNSSIINSEFRGPGPILTKNDDGDFSLLDGQLEEDFHFSNLDLWTATDNITIENNEFYLSHDGTGAAGLSLQIRDLWQTGVNNIFVKNNYFEKVSHDEIFAISPRVKDIENIEVEDNEFVMYDGVRSKSPIGISIGAPNPYDSGYVKNLDFNNNSIDIEYTFRGLQFDFISDEFNFMNNDINLNMSYDSAILSPTSIYFTDKINSNTVFNISKNTFDINVENGEKLTNISRTVLDNSSIIFDDNYFNINGVVEQWFENGMVVTNNIITSNNYASELTRNLREFSYNDVTLTYANSINTLFNDTIEGTYNYTNNNVIFTDVSAKNDSYDMYTLVEIGGSSTTIDTLITPVINFNNNTVGINDDEIRNNEAKVVYYGPSNPNSFIINLKNNNTPKGYIHYSDTIKGFIISE